MGLLDDLKDQSDNLKAKEAQEKQRKADLEKYYRESISPKMLQVYNFLSQFGEHLNYIKADTVAKYPLLPKGQVLDFRQREYKINIDSSSNIKNIHFQFTAQLDSPVKFDMENGEAIERYSDVLNSYKMAFKRNDYKNNEYELISSTFTLRGPIPVSIIFQGDVENSAINLLLTNFEKPGTVKHIFKDRHITEEFLDGLGKYLLRDNEKFFKLDIEEGHKEELRKKLQQEMIKRQQELEEAERLLREEEEREKEQKSWKNLFKKKD